MLQWDHPFRKDVVRVTKKNITVIGTLISLASHVWAAVQYYRAYAKVRITDVLHIALDFAHLADAIA